MKSDVRDRKLEVRYTKTVIFFVNNQAPDLRPPDPVSNLIYPKIQKLDLFFIKYLKKFCVRSFIGR